MGRFLTCSENHCCNRVGDYEPRAYGSPGLLRSLYLVSPLTREHRVTGLAICAGTAYLSHCRLWFDHASNQWRR
jgi:hypothetical protein